MSKQFVSFVRRAASMAAAPVAGTLALVAGSAHAVDPISTMLASVDLTAVAAAVAAICLLVVGIALTFKSPDIAKRVIRKV